MQRAVVRMVAGLVLLLVMMVLPSACQTMSTSMIPTVAPEITTPVGTTPSVTGEPELEQQGSKEQLPVVQRGDTTVRLVRVDVTASHTVVEFAIEDPLFPRDFETMYNLSIWSPLQPGEDLHLSGFAEEAVLGRRNSRRPGVLQLELELPPPETKGQPVVIEIEELQVLEAEFGAEQGQFHDLGGPWRFEFVPVTSTVPTARLQTVEQAVQQVDFQVKVPAWLPFEPAYSYALIVSIGGDLREFPEGSVKNLEITYVSPDEDTITITQAKVHVTDQSSIYEQQSVELAGGIQAQYKDNGTAQILSWQDGEIFYSIAGIGAGTYTPEQLARIANSLEPISPSSAVQVTKEVLVTKVTPSPSPTPLACTPLPEGMTLQVEALSPTGLQVEVDGLGPDERPTLILSSEVPHVGSRKFTTQDAEPVGADGRYTYQTRWLEAVGASTDNRWEVKIVHARGVACTEIVLPPALVGAPAEPVHLAENIELERYLLSAVGMIPEKSVLVTLHWRGERAPAKDRVTLRLRGPEGGLWSETARSHTPRVVGHFAPTTQHWLELPAGVRHGTYTVEAVVKDPLTREATRRNCR